MNNNSKNNVNKLLERLAQIRQSLNVLVDQINEQVDQTDFKMLASDVDGTLTRGRPKTAFTEEHPDEVAAEFNDPSIPFGYDPLVMYVISKLKLKSVLVSGRSFTPLLYSQADLSLAKDVVLSENGGYLEYDLKKSTGEKKRISLALGNKNLARIGYDYLNSVIGPLVIDYDSTRITDCLVRKVDGFIFQDIQKMLDDHFGANQIMVTDSGSTHWHLHGPHGTKGNAVKTYANHVGIDLDQIIICGNAANDQSMFKIFKNTVCPANGTASIKQMTNYLSEKPYGVGTLEGILYYLYEAPRK